MTEEQIADYREAFSIFDNVSQKFFRHKIKSYNN